MENEMESGFVVFVSFIFKADKVPKSIKRAEKANTQRDKKSGTKAFSRAFWGVLRRVLKKGWRKG